MSWKLKLFFSRHEFPLLELGNKGIRRLSSGFARAILVPAILILIVDRGTRLLYLQMPKNLRRDIHDCVVAIPYKVCYDLKASKK
jgi:hypothetical protein